MITDHNRDLAVAKANSGGLLNLTELALVFDVGRDFVKAMVRAGFVTFSGKTTREDALLWLRTHPDFKDRQQQNLPKFRRKLAIQRRKLPISKNGCRSRVKVSKRK
jgi:hypothetical protein